MFQSKITKSENFFKVLNVQYFTWYSCCKGIHNLIVYFLSTRCFLSLNQRKTIPRIQPWFIFLNTFLPNQRLFNSLSHKIIPLDDHNKIRLRLWNDMLLRHTIIWQIRNNIWLIDLKGVFFTCCESTTPTMLLPVLHAFCSFHRKIRRWINLKSWF